MGGSRGLRSRFGPEFRVTDPGKRHLSLSVELGKYRNEGYAESQELQTRSLDTRDGKVITERAWHARLQYLNMIRSQVSVKSNNVWPTLMYLYFQFCPDDLYIYSKRVRIFIQEISCSLPQESLVLAHNKSFLSKYAII